MCHIFGKSLAAKPFTAEKKEEKKMHIRNYSVSGEFFWCPQINHNMSV